MCELLNGDEKIYYEDKNILIIPNINPSNYKERRLCIWKTHKKVLNTKELYIFIKTLIKIRNKLNKKGGWWDIVLGLRTHPKHFHLHLAKI